MLGIESDIAHLSSTILGYVCAAVPHRVKSSKNSKANRIETGERSGGIGEICSVEVDEK